jgi:hypothetical protein
MAYTAGTLHLRAGAPGDLTYTHDAGSDTMTTVLTAGYFNNSDDNLNMTADDLIWSQCTDGSFWHRVSAVSSGSVTTQFAGGNMPVGSPGTSSATAVKTLTVGHYEVGTSITKATRFVLPTVYAGAEVIVRRDDSGSKIIQFDAGGSGATGVTYDSVGNRVIKLQTEGEGFHVVGVSATRWRIYALNTNASLVAPGGGSVALGAT